MDPPVVPHDRLDGWRRVDETTDQPFAAGPVSVTSSTVRYERTETPPPRPFCFASRLRIRPPTGPNAALTRLIEKRARDGFRERLAERDIEAVRHERDREIGIDDPRAGRAALSTFRGVCPIESEVDEHSGDEHSGDEGSVSTTDGPVPVEALLAVWEAGEYLLAGGAYPLAGETEDARRELVRIIRGVRPPSEIDEDT